MSIPRWWSRIALALGFLGLGQTSSGQALGRIEADHELGRESTCQPSWLPTFGGLPGVNSVVRALTVFDDGGGPALYAAGSFMSAGGTAANRIAKWDGSSWAALGSGLNSDVYALAVFDDGGGPALYAGGGFTYAGGTAANRIAKWDGSSWTVLASGMNSDVLALSMFDDGGGPALYAAGYFTNAGGAAANSIAKWDGSSWTALSSGMNNDVNSLSVFDDGSGPALYAGGAFSSAGGVPASSIARWDGSSWTALGSGIGGGSFHAVYALSVFDGGGGQALYAGGFFTSAGGAAANAIAKWDGSSWSTLGSGVGGASFPAVYALSVFDDGGGAALHAGGSFTSAGGTAANAIAKRNGSSWAALGSGMNSRVEALAVFDDGGGPALYAGGFFTSAGGSAANSIARWDGSNWTPLGSGVGGVTLPAVFALTVFNDRTGPALYAGGSFASALDSGDSYLAKWGCPDTNPPAITCPPSIVVDDRERNGRGEILTFTVTAFDEEDPTPSLVCVPPSGSLFPRGTTLVTCTATDFSGNQATCQFTVNVQFKRREP